MKKISAYLFVLYCTHIFACSVPVFRYALERWYPDPYILKLNYNESQTNELAEVLTTVRKYDNGYSLDIKKIKTSNSLSRVVLQYPKKSGVMTNVCDAAMTVGNVEKMLDSPARREIARRIIAGDSVVFLLLKGDDEKKNKKTADFLSKNLPVIEKNIELPHEYTDIPEEDLQIYDTNIVFKLSMFQLSKNNPEDKVFINMLTRIIPAKILTNSYPIVYPVFARGRILTAMLAKEVTKRNLEGVCEYIAGECSCEIKGQNPGIDLLFSVDWDSLIEPGIDLDVMLPPLAGFSEFVPEKIKTNSAVAAKPLESNDKLKLWRNITILICVIAAGGAIYAFRSSRRSS